LPQNFPAPEILQLVISDLTSAEIEKSAERLHVSFSELRGLPYIFSVDDFCSYNCIHLLQQIRVEALEKLPPALIYISPSKRRHIILPGLSDSNLRSLYVATQIGHLQLHLPEKTAQNGAVFLREEVPQKCFEQAALFAMAFLLPKFIIEPIIAEKNRRAAIDGLAVELGIPTQVIKGRLAQLTPA